MNVDAHRDHLDVRPRWPIKREGMIAKQADVEVVPVRIDIQP